MAGQGVLQVVALGQQNLFLTDQPIATFFKGTYKKHSMFALESIEQTFNGTPNFGQRATVPVPRAADLCHKMYLEVNLPAITNTGPKTVAWTREIGHVLIKTVKIIIGSQTFDTHYGEWLSIFNSLTNATKIDGYNTMIGNITTLTDQDTSIDAAKLYIPLQFWFNRYVGSSLPLIAQAYSDTKIEFEFRPVSECYVTSDGGTPDATPVLGSTSLWVDYVFLSEEERVAFAQSPHEYLIEQVQYHDESLSQTTNRVKMALNHPSKEMVWVYRLDANTTDGSTASARNRWVDFTSNGAGGSPYAGGQTVASAKLLLNGGERFQERTGDYFNLVQPFQHHTAIPPNGIYVYSFALEPERFQPTGSLNFSRIDNPTLHLTLVGSLGTGTLMVFVPNHNIMRVLGGQTGIVFQN